MATRLAVLAVAKGTIAKLTGLTGTPQVSADFVETDSYPRVFVDTAPGEPMDAHDQNGEIVPVYVHAYTAGNQVYNTWLLLDEIKQKLADVTLSLDYGRTGVVHYDGGDRAIRDPDGLHCSGVVRFRVFVDNLGT